MKWMGSGVTFEEFANARLGPLLRAAVVICGDASLAEDLVQDVLIKAQAQWVRVSSAREPDAYVRRMLVNEYLSWRRKWARVVPRADVEPGPALGDHADRFADRDLLSRALAQLPRRQRVVLALRYYVDLSDDQIAETLGCAPATVRSYASRALAALRAGEAAHTFIEVETPGRRDA